jgi:ribosomal protein S7
MIIQKNKKKFLIKKKDPILYNVLIKKLINFLIKKGIKNKYLLLFYKILKNIKKILNINSLFFIIICLYKILPPFHFGITSKKKKNNTN